MELKQGCIIKKYLTSHIHTLLAKITSIAITVYLLLNFKYVQLILGNHVTSAVTYTHECLVNNHISFYVSWVKSNVPRRISKLVFQSETPHLAVLAFKQHSCITVRVNRPMELNCLAFVQMDRTTFEENFKMPFKGIYIF